ncbi:hypothetical protein [Pararhizobium mangrovi]|uniref:hypothetical protein n=1 Tax=Pararhizobium mangrovi TaxID=2590452 RepID=UPI0015E86B4F|nr:hypothetical protein [Pararhizobium mangrovi]
MARPDPETDEKPLDPAMESVRRKMLRTLAVSIGIMFVGLMAVAGAIVYKISSEPERAQSAAAGEMGSVPGGDVRHGDLSLPEGFSVERVALDGSRILFYGKRNDGTAHALIYDVTSGSLLRDIALKG